MSDQPEALRLADELTASVGTQSTYSAMQQAAAELRRLHKAETDFHMGYRMKCDAETKKLQAERDAAVAVLETVLRIPSMSDADLEQLRINCKAAIDAARSKP